MTNILSAEDREEYDALLRAAAYDSGRLVPVTEAAGRAHGLLVVAVKAGRTWADIQMERALTEGLCSEMRRYLKRAYTTTETDDLLGSRSRPKIYSVPQESADGSTYMQPMLFEDMALDDLDSVIADSNKRIVANERNRQTAIRLREFLKSVVGAKTVREALAKTGKSLEQVLAV